jgi:hypothetical protein
LDLAKVYLAIVLGKIPMDLTLLCSACLLGFVAVLLGLVLHAQDQLRRRSSQFMHYSKFIMGAYHAVVFRKHHVARYTWIWIPAFNTYNTIYVTVAF